MTKKRVFAGIAVLSFVWATVLMFREQNTPFAALFAILFAVLAVSLFLPNVKLLQVIPLVLLLVLSWLCIIPWSYKIAANLNMLPATGLQQSWWNEKWVNAFATYRPLSFMQLLGFGTVSWLHLDCISAILGVIALALITVCALLKDTMSSMKSVLQTVMLVLLIASGFSAMLCVAYFFTFCSIMEE